jgi:hypothetical protein
LFVLGKGGEEGEEGEDGFLGHTGGCQVMMIMFAASEFRQE